MHLRYNTLDSSECGNIGHPQLVMKELGISYRHATPQSICDEWWFWNCSNIPEVLPKFITPLDLDPLQQIGWGLSKEVAEDIANHAKKKQTGLNADKLKDFGTFGRGERASIYFVDESAFLERTHLVDASLGSMTFKEALDKLGISEYGERIFRSNSHGELFHLHQYIQIARLSDVSWFKEWFEMVVKEAEKKWNRPESVFQHILEILQQQKN